MCMEYFEPAGTVKRPKPRPQWLEREIMNKENHLAADGDLSVPVSVQRSVWEISGCSQQEYHCMEVVHF